MRIRCAAIVSPRQASGLGDVEGESPPHRGPIGPTRSLHVRRRFAMRGREKVFRDANTLLARQSYVRPLFLSVTVIVSSAMANARDNSHAGLPSSEFRLSKENAKKRRDLVLLIFREGEIENAVFWMTKTTLPETVINRHKRGLLQRQQYFGHAVVKHQFAGPQVLQSCCGDPLQQPG